MDEFLLRHEKVLLFVVLAVAAVVFKLWRRNRVETPRTPDQWHARLIFQAWAYAVPPLVALILFSCAAVWLVIEMGSALPLALLGPVCLILAVITYLRLRTLSAVRSAPRLPWDAMDLFRRQMARLPRATDSASARARLCRWTLPAQAINRGVGVLFGSFVLGILCVPVLFVLLPTESLSAGWFFLLVFSPPLLCVLGGIVFLTKLNSSGWEIACWQREGGLQGIVKQRNGVPPDRIDLLLVHRRMRSWKRHERPHEPIMVEVALAPRASEDGWKFDVGFDSLSAPPITNPKDYDQWTLALVFPDKKGQSRIEFRLHPPVHPVRVFKQYERVVGSGFHERR